MQGTICAHLRSRVGRISDGQAIAEALPLKPAHKHPIRMLRRCVLILFKDL